MAQEFNPEDNPEMRWVIPSNQRTANLDGEQEVAATIAPVAPHSGKLDTQQGGELPVRDFDNTPPGNAVAQDRLKMPEDGSSISPQASQSDQTAPRWGGPTTHHSQPGSRIRKFPVWARVTAGAGALLAAGGIYAAGTSVGESHDGKQPVAASLNNSSSANGRNQGNQGKASTSPKTASSPTGIGARNQENSNSTPPSNAVNGESLPTSHFTLDQLSQSDITYLASRGITEDNVADLPNRAESIDTDNLATDATKSPYSAIEGAYRTSILMAYNHDNPDLTTILLFGDNSPLGGASKKWMGEILAFKQNLENQYGPDTKLVFSVTKPQDPSFDSSYPYSKIQTVAGTNLKTATVCVHMAIFPQSSANPGDILGADNSDEHFDMIGLPGNNGAATLWLIADKSSGGKS